jgi:Xaa-Pro dipeptidase
MRYPGAVSPRPAAAPANLADRSAGPILTGMATELSLRISDQELAARRAALLDRLAPEDAGAVVLFGPTAILYLTGFSFIPTERPLAMAFTRDRLLAMVPSLEREHVGAAIRVDEVVTYDEYPGERPPLELLARALDGLGLGGRALGVDADGYPPRYGYRGPRLSELLPARQVSCAAMVEDLRLVKSEQELALLRESSRWADGTHRHLQSLVRAGANENEVAIRASLAGSQDMVSGLGPDFDPRGWVMLPTTAGFRSQIGANAALPHAINRNLVMREGDVLVTGASSLVWGYRCELERTMFVGEPSDEQRRLFGLMAGAQEAAFEAMRPGRRCADVDRAVRDYFERRGIAETWRHHVGHGLGMEVHEAPFLDVGDDRVMEPGMVFSVEPGVYVPGLGGFRHSDTVAITDDGIELMTRYPRDLDSLVCAV